MISSLAKQINISIHLIDMNFGNLDDGVHQIKQEQVLQLSKLMTKAFLKNNPIWSKYKMTAAHLDPFFENLLLDHLASEKRAQNYMRPNTSLNYIYVSGGHVVATILHYEIEQYRQILKAKKEPSLQVFKDMEKYGAELLKDVDLNVYEKGKHVYGNFGAIDDEVMRPKASFLILLDFCKKLKDSGIDSMIGRSSNERTNQLYVLLGGKILKEMQFEQNELKEKVALLSLNFHNEKFIALCDQYAKNKKVKPKL